MSNIFNVLYEEDSSDSEDFTYQEHISSLILVSKNTWVGERLPHNYVFIIEYSPQTKILTYKINLGTYGKKTFEYKNEKYDEITIPVIMEIFNLKFR